MTSDLICSHMQVYPSVSSDMMRLFHCEKIYEEYLLVNMNSVVVLKMLAM